MMLNPIVDILLINHIQTVHHQADAQRTVDGKRQRATLHPRGKVYFVKLGNMIRVKVRQQYASQPLQRQPGHHQIHGRTGAGINHKEVCRRKHCNAGLCSCRVWQR